MTKVQKFCGVDVSKRNFHAAVETGNGVCAKAFAYNEEGMHRFLEHLPEGVHCIMESTGTYHCRLAYFLAEHGVSVSVVNPLSVRRYAQALMSRTKTDKADCRLLIEFGRTFTPKAWKPKSSRYVELQQLVNLQELLVRQRTALSNQLEAVAYSVVQGVAKGLLEDQLAHLDRKLKEVEREAERLAALHAPRELSLLTSIPGVGKKTAVTLLSLTDGVQGFSSYRQLSSYLGLCPRLYESGTSVKGKARICKMGMGTVRKLLYMCALSAARANRACRELYARLLAKGKQKKLILIAIANKLLKQIFAVVKSGLAYNENFLSKKLAYEHSSC